MKHTIYMLTLGAGALLACSQSAAGTAASTETAVVRARTEAAGGADATTTGTDATTTDGALGAEAAPAVEELPLPDVPLTLREPAERAAYVIGHFWDAMDFTDARRALDRDFVEQNFSNFISVFPYADEGARRQAVGTLLSRAAADSAAYMTVLDVAELYLFDPNSPMRSEEFYLPFLEYATTAQTPFAYPTARLHYQIEAVRKNRPGMPAADFAFVTRAGRATSLRAEVEALRQKPSGTQPQGRSDARRTDVATTEHAAEAPHLLLVFYDPDCDHCREVMSALQEDAELAHRVADGRMGVVAVYSGEDRTLWERTAATLPEAWTVGYESGLLQDDGRYILRAMPTLYLIGADGRVVLKDCAWQDALRVEDER